MLRQKRGTTCFAVNHSGDFLFRRYRRGPANQITCGEARLSRQKPSEK
ncbi:hypothetical protein [Pleionea sp. CnH1-48]|nr:hypothetical protein [Pleionea sp. CnH1-48]MCO7227230.1 hypothetical protein [Pleionea sp. CnH1-48]